MIADIDICDETSLVTDVCLQTGVGYSVDVVTAKNYGDYKKGVSVLDRAKLGSADFDKNIDTYNSVKTYSTNSVSDLLTKSSISYNLNTDIGIKASGMTAGIQFGLTSGANFEYKKYSERYYSVLDHYIKRFSLSLADYAVRGRYTEYLSDGYKKSLAQLMNERDENKFNRFFHTYGTHLIGSAIFGGRLNTYFSTVTNKVSINSDTVKELSAGLNFGMDGVEGSSKVTETIKKVLGKEATDTEISFTAVAFGGNSFGASSIDDFKSNYKAWWNSFNCDSHGDSNCVLINYADDGLIPLWEMLPDEYSSLAAPMQEAFKKYYRDSYNNVIDAFKFSNTVDYAGGSGKLDDPYLISTAEHLANIELNMGAYFKLTQDVDVNQYSDWLAIGGHYRQKAFNGVLDGCGYSIKSLHRTSDIAERDKRIYFGLFGYIGAKGVVKNLIFENVNVHVTGPRVNDAKTRVYFGVVAGTLYGKVENVQIKSGEFKYDADTNGNAHVGGICGYAYGARIANCTNSIHLVSRRYASTLGGIVGEGADIKFYSCENTGALYAYHYIGGYCYVGGIIGQSFEGHECSYDNCKNEGDMEFKGYKGACSNICPTAKDPLCAHNARQELVEKTS